MDRVFGDPPLLVQLEGADCRAHLVDGELDVSGTAVTGVDDAPGAKLPDGIRHFRGRRGAHVTPCPTLSGRDRKQFVRRTLGPPATCGGNGEHETIAAAHPHALYAKTSRCFSR